MTDTATRTTTSSPTSTAADQVLGSDIGLLVLRVVFGGLFAAHGAQKLFGWFGGNGLDATIDGFTKMGYNPGELFGTLAGLTEFVGGLALLLGLCTPLAAAAILGTMINAIYIKLDDGLLGSGGYELALLYAVAAITLAFTGPGRLSLDHGRPWARRGLVWGGAAVALGIVTATITLILKAVF
ncbi:DoxX family protein [Nocardia mangyaensis]|uniref:DoxX family protein n=1 Tax=Nocardia mangyaensis TaxID=2213200 RepID=UPI002674B0A6|nr:DoxX family protein [Nocardia mangyaensis]MDO3648022.1 DoxX family protein [Nocardia mangyaensis]